MILKLFYINYNNQLILFNFVHEINFLINKFFFLAMDRIEEAVIIDSIRNIVRYKIILDLILNSKESNINKFCYAIICVNDIVELLELTNQSVDQN